MHREFLSATLRVHRQVVLADACEDIGKLGGYDRLEIVQHLGGEFLVDTYLEPDDILAHDIVYHDPEGQIEVGL